MEEGSQELTHVGRYSIAERARSMFDVGQIDLIKATVMPQGANDAELALFLETCIRHDFDPFIREIWAIKLNGKVQPVASVDGLRKKANESPDFRGCSSGVVREYDLFDFEYAERDDETTRVKIRHSPRNASGEPTHGGENGGERGPIVGAWAIVRREAHSDVFFLAYWKQYGAQKAKDSRTPWHSTPDTMITKAAESVALRKAFNVAGVIGEGEEPRRVQNLAAGSEGGSSEIEWPDDETLAEELQRRFKVLGYRRAKVRMLVNACEGDSDRLRALLVQLDNELDGGERVADAQVVE